MKKLIAIIGLLFYTSPLALPAFAQEEVDAEAEEPESPVQIVIAGPHDIAVGRTLVLDASATTGLGEGTTYRWYRQGFAQPISRSVEAVFTPERVGITTMRLVVRTLIDGEPIEVEATRDITVYQRKVVLLADKSISAEKLELHRQVAEEGGTFLRIMQPEEAAIPLAGEDTLSKLISEESTNVQGAEAIVLWTEGVTGLQALMRAVEADPEKWQGLSNQTIVMITDSSLHRLSRTARGPFSVLEPKLIMTTRKEAINPLLAATDMGEFIAQLEQRDIDFETVDESTTRLRPWNALTWLVNYMLTHGVSSQTVILLLSLPVIAMILAFLKQVVGLTTFGLFTPSIVALSFIALGWQIGLLLLIFIIITGYATRASMKRWRLLYIPKVAVILTVISLTLLILLAIGASFGILLAPDTIFVLLIMSTLGESFLNVKAEEGWLNAIIGIGETILAALLCVFIVQWAALQSLILAYPELILITIVLNIFLGRWTGLRLVEYFRFKEVFKHLQEE